MSRTAATRAPKAIQASRALVLVAPSVPAAKPDAAQRDAVVANLAMGLGFETLKIRHRDHLNSNQVSVQELKAALEAAYQAGLDAAKKG